VQVKFEEIDHIAVITINRPDRRNAVDRETADQLVHAFERFEHDSSLHVAVLTGAENNFCAGADLKAFAEGRGNTISASGNGPMGPTRMRLSKPVIAAVEGYCVAGGLELALWADLRVASSAAVFGVFCRRLGVPLIDLGTIRLPRLIGQSRAMDLILTGRSVLAQEGFDIGLVNRLVEPGNALSTSLQLAREIAAFPQTCMREDRLSVYEQWSLSDEQAIENEINHGMKSLRSNDAMDGATAFSESKNWRHGKF
jgi:enoyl-CoA hydratase